MEDYQKIPTSYLDTEFYELAYSYAQVYTRFKKLHKKWNRQYSNLYVSDVDPLSFVKWISGELKYVPAETGQLAPYIPLQYKRSSEYFPIEINGLKWSPLSISGVEEDSLGLLEYNQLLDHIARAFGNILTYSSTEYTSYKEDAIFRVRAKLLAVSELLNSIDKILASLFTEELPDKLPPKPANFVKDNKMPAPDDDHIERQQLPLSMAEDLADTLDLTDKEMATILTISIRTYHRLKQKGLLNPVASERLVMLKDLAAYGLEVFEDQRNFNEWLRSPLHELNNKSPLSLLDTATGIARVKTILGRIDYGVFS